ncbi:conjugal transfer protein TraO [Aquimarina sp. MMG015]|uniref:conjugal transfer protein TraO n=1 Tax=Aquimarina TaxID=290174 RepID=UPI0003FA034E|nr:MULTISPECIES: conjugal transfer protein TraO [Aquimarina]MBQ4804851.1 conjugal transfer protein TraO [Aquimarina sp. MMG015]
MNNQRKIKKQFLYTLLLPLVLWSYSSSLSAQSHKVAFSINGGIVQDGFSGMISGDYKVNEFDYIQFNLQGSFTTLEQNNIDIPVNTYSFNAGFFFDILRNNSRTFAFSLGAGGTVGYEIINDGDSSIENNQILTIETKNIIYGAYAGIDADIFLSPVITLNVKLNEIYHINSEIGELTPYAGLGVKLILK